MSAVDAPPGLAISDLAAGEFAARPGAYKLARRSFAYVVVFGGLTMALATRRLHVPYIEFLFVAPLVCLSVGGLGFAVRRARIRIDADGVRWGWALIGFRMRCDRLREVRVFRDAVALVPRRGSTWYLSRRDWDRFAGMAQALETAAIPFTRSRERAPLLARLQGYGLVLDSLLVANILAVTFALLAALSV